MRFLVLLSLVFFVGLTSATETTYTYLVYVSSFPYVQDLVDLPRQARLAGYSNLVDQGYATHFYPLKQTRQFVCPNTNYLMLEVTPKSASQQGLFESLESQGRIRIIEKSVIVSEFDTRLGWDRTHIDRVELGTLPPDINKNWSVVIST